MNHSSRNHHRQPTRSVTGGGVIASTISKLKRVGASRNSFVPPRCYRIVKIRADNQTRTTADPLPDEHPNALIKIRADGAH